MSKPGRLLAPDASLLALPGSASEAFVHGIEILNDDKTPMAFVVRVFEEHLQMDKTSAIRAMLQIHTEGGILIPLPSREDAVRIANAVTLGAKSGGHPLICRAVSVDAAV